MKTENRKQFMNRVGAKMKNARFSWAGVNHDSRQIFVTAWLDQKFNDAYLIFSENWHDNKKGKKDTRDLLKLVTDEQYELNLVFAEAVDVNAASRQVSKIRGSFYMTAFLTTDPMGNVYATPVTRINL